jgi:hypothetical protein
MAEAPEKRFTYGAQFTPEKTPLPQILKLAEEHANDRVSLQAAISSQFFSGHGSSSDGLAGNCVLSLNAYQLIKLQPGGKKYDLTEQGQKLLALADDTESLYRQFAIHILLRLYGLTLARVIENMRAREEPIRVDTIAERLQDLGFSIPPNGTYVSTMRNWLSRAGVFAPTGYEIRWDVIDQLLGIDVDTISSLYKLTIPQKYFLLSMARLHAVDYIASNAVAKYVRNIYRTQITTKALVKDVVEPLVAIGLVDSQKTTGGRGAKPHEVRLTETGRQELLIPLLEALAKATELEVSDINRPFREVVEELSHESTHVRGIALELFAVWIIRLLGLRFSHWRFKNLSVGEVDLIAASDRIVYSRWQVQCKNTPKPINVKTVQEEVGVSFVTKADVIMLVTTGTFSSHAVEYANLVTDTSRYYIILLDKNDVARIRADASTIVDILNVKARRVFALKELGRTDFGEQAPAEAADEESEGEA